MWLGWMRSRDGSLVKEQRLSLDCERQWRSRESVPPNERKQINHACAEAELAHFVHQNRVLFGCAVLCMRSCVGKNAERLVDLVEHSLTKLFHQRALSLRAHAIAIATKKRAAGVVHEEARRLRSRLAVWQYSTARWVTHGSRCVC